MKRFKNWLITKLGGQISKSISNGVTITDGISYMDAGLNETYIFDFKNWNGGNSGYFGNTIGSNESDGETEKVQKIKVKPIEVLDKLETVPTPFDLLGIDDKITVLKDKEALISQHYAKREVSALIKRLENRKLYTANKEFFDQFQNTTDEKIDNLLSKYDLLMKTSDIFVPEFPDDAIAIMKEYSEKTFELFGAKPVYYVIADEDKFRKAYEKRDPILLVQSPFGFYWQILGAWDEEMLILGEL